MSGRQKRRCWAEAVSPCRGKLSREHPFTRASFTSGTVDFVNVVGPGAGTTRLNIDAVTVRCLCEGHNNELSAVDQAGVDFFNCIRRQEELLSLRRRQPDRRWSWHTLCVDGKGVERWLMKTALNLSYLRREQVVGWEPPTSMAEAVFALRDLPSGAGLASFGVVGGSLLMGDYVVFQFLWTGAGELAGVLAVLLGYPFVIAWDRPVRSLFPLDFGAGVVPAERVVQPICNLQVAGESGRGPNLRVRLDYSGRWREQDHPRVVELRGRYAPPGR